MPVRNEEWMGLNNFVWFFGVVEAINDPLNIGRVRVRCNGWHSEDTNTLPSDKLPWAQVMVPVTSASFAGIGRSPTGLLVDSHVIGFFMDGSRAQAPMIIGSFHGVSNPLSEPPIGPDTPNLAYDYWVNDKITKDKDSGRIQNIPTASRYKVSSVSHDKSASDYEAVTWNEPIQRIGSGEIPSNYPANHVTQTESGHAFEVDDTLGCERIHEYHTTGTFYEIQPDGSRITKITANDYEIVIKDKDVFVSGDCNLTVNGNARVYVVGDMIQEIKGDHHLTVWGDAITKIMGNESKEILGSASHQINGNEVRRITGDNNIQIGGSLTENIKVNMSSTVVGDSTSTISGDCSITSKGNTTIISVGDMNIGSGGKAAFASDSNLNIKSNSQGTLTASAWAVTSDINLTGSLTSSADVVASGKSLKLHVHVDPQGGSTAAPT